MFVADFALWRLQEAGAGTFSPDTGNAAQVLALSAAVERLLESPSERTHRLAVQVNCWDVLFRRIQDAADVRQAREGAQAEYYRQFNVKPATNPRSRQLAQVRRTVAAHKKPASPSLSASQQSVLYICLPGCREEPRK